MNYDELVTLAESVGLNENRARIAAAIAMAESGGIPSKVTQDSDDDSWGLWQINFKGDLIDRLRQFGLENKQAVLDPRRNAMVMAHISSNGGNFNAWTTYTSGKYEKFLKDKSLIDKAADAINGVKEGAQNAVDNTIAIGTAASNFAESVQKAGAWISNSANWVRVAYVVGGGALVLVSTYALLRSSGVSVSPKQVKQVVKVVKTVKGKASAS